MNKRVTTYLPEGIYELLEKWAGKEKRSISNLSAFLIETAVRERYDVEEPDESLPLKKRKQSKEVGNGKT